MIIASPRCRRSRTARRLQHCSNIKHTHTSILYRSNTHITTHITMCICVYVYVCMCIYTCMPIYIYMYANEAVVSLQPNVRTLIIASRHSLRNKQFAMMSRRNQFATMHLGNRQFLYQLLPIK